MKVSASDTLGTSFQKLYECNRIQTLTVDALHICNTSKNKSLVSVCLCSPGQSPALSNALLWDLSVQGNDHTVDVLGLVCPPRYMLWAKSDTAGVVNCNLSGSLV